MNRGNVLHNILVVDDEEIIRTTVGNYFENKGYIVSFASDGKEMKEVLKNKKIDVVLLDINLPGDDGLVLTRTLRSQSDIGIIIVSTRADEIDKIIGLEMGADDYVTKPISLRELLVRVKNLLWRIDRSEKKMGDNLVKTDDEIVNFDGWHFNTNRRALSKNGTSVNLTKAEYEMLIAFTANPNRVLSRDRILNLLSHRVDAPNDRIVDVLVRRLRNKIESEPKKPQLFITVHGEGYMFAGK